jgi:hypothetical protein
LYADKSLSETSAQLQRYFEQALVRSIDPDYQL